MPERDLATLVRSLTPGALRLYKQQLSSLPERDKQVAFSKLAGIEELADIVGRPAQRLTPKPVREQPEPKAVQQEVPLWAKGLQAAGAPFNWIQERITEPFGAVATAPFTPGLPGGRQRGESPLAYARRQYEQWQEPTWTMPWGGEFRPTKGIVETLPWFALPTAGGIVGKLGGLAAKGGALGKAAGYGATALKPVAVAEQVINPFAWKRGISSFAAKRAGGGRLVPEKVTPAPKVTTDEAIRRFEAIQKAEQAKIKYGIDITKVTEAEYIKAGLAQYRKEAKELGFSLDIKKQTQFLKEEYSKVAIPKAKPVPEAVTPGLGKIIPKKGMRIDPSNEHFKRFPDDDAFFDRERKEIVFRDAVAARNKKTVNHEMAHVWLDSKITNEGNDFLADYAELIGETKYANAIRRSPGTTAKESSESWNSIHESMARDFATFYQNPDALNPKIHAYLGKILPKETIFEVAIPTMGKAPSAIWADLSKPQRMTLANGAGITHRVDWRAWNSIAPDEQKLLADQMAKLGAEPSKYRIVSEMFPSGMDEKQTDAVVAILELVKQSKPITKSILALRKPEQAARAAEMGKLRQQYIEQGMSAREAGNRAMAALRDPYPTEAMTPEFKKLLADLGDKEDTLFTMLNEAPFKSEFDWLNTHTALQDLLLENPLQRNQIARLEKVFGSELAKAILAKRGWGEKAREFLIELANAPRALLASGDASYLLRQGAMGLAGYPKVGIKTFAPSIEATFSPKFAGELDSIIRARPHSDIMIEHGLAITPLPGRRLAASLAEREEAFISGLFEKLSEHIPAFRKVNFISASNRGYVSGLNNLRSNISEQVLNIAEAAGRKVTDLDLDELAGFVNAITGRGDLHFEALKRADSLLNAIFFAPKLIASRIQVFKYLWSPSELARREAWRTLPRFFGIGIAMLTAAKLSGAAEVELDPRSADFGKLKFEDTRLDIWTGYSQYARFLAQLAVAQRKTEGGRIVRLNRKDVGLRFIQTKLSPAMGFFNDLATGETYLGEDFLPKSAKSFRGQVWERFAPLAIQDIIQGVQADGFMGGRVASLGLLGIGIATYTDEVKRARDKIAQKELGLSWDEVGTKYGRATQLKLEQTPAIIEAEKEHEDRFAGGTPTSMDNFRNEGKLVEDTYRKDVDNAVREFRATNNGKLFREKITKASENRRAAYSLRAKKDEYQDIIAYYTQPIPADKLAEMNPGDVLRREYYQQMFDPIKMYDEFGNYRFDEADKIERKFVVKNGQQAMDYIEEYQGARWQDKPVELKMLEEARELLRPYWDTADKVWEMYPKGLQEISDHINIMENGTDEQQRLAKMQLRKYPMILRARELIVRYKQQMRQYNPAINQAYKMFY